MAIDPTSTDHANIKMRGDRVLAAFGDLPRKGAKGGIRKPDGIRKGGDARSHFQGAAIRDGHAFLTLSGKRNGSIIGARGSGRSFTQSRRVRIRFERI